MPYVNEVRLRGYVIKDPVFKNTLDGRPVADFFVATKKRFKDRNGKSKVQIDSHDIVAWGRFAEFTRDYVKKQSCVFIDGSLKKEKWCGSNGEKHFRMVVEVKKWLQVLCDGGIVKEVKMDDVDIDESISDEDCPF